MSTSARRPDQQPSDRFTLAHILSDHSQSIALVIAPDGIILDLNARMALVLGRPLKQLKGTYLQAYLPPETYAAFQVSFCETVNSRQPSRHDLECGGRWYDCRLTPCVDEQDQVVAVSAVGWDITERKEAERRNADLTALLEGTLECTADGILVTDGCGEMLLSNRRFAEMWRLPEAILASGDDRAALQFAQAQLERPEEFFAEVNNLYANPEVTAFSRLRFKDGRVFERYSHSRSLTNGVIGRVWSFRDVTAKARAEASLRQQAEEVHDLYNHAPCGYHSLDRDGVVVRMNDTELAWLGYSREEVIGKLKITDLLTVSGSVVFAQLFPHFQATGSVSEIELELVRKDGSLLPVSISATAVTDAEGRFVMSRSTIHDIRGRRRKEEELRRTVASLAEAQEIAHLGSFVYDVTQNLVVHSPQLDRILGLGPDTERTPDAWSRLVHPDDRTAVAAVLKACLESGVPFDVDYRVNRASDGETRWLRGTGRAERDVSGKVIRISGVNLDITERKEAEMALARSAHSSERLRGALMALNRCADLDSALSCLLREAIGLTGLDGGGVYVLEGGEALLRHQIGLPAEFVSKVARRALDTPHVKAVFEHPGEVLDLTSQFPNPREWGEPHGLRHVYSTALATEQGPLAMLTLASLQPEPTSAYSLELIRILTLEMESVFRRLAVADRLQRVGW